jgi:hypothetical protein
VDLFDVGTVVVNVGERVHRFYDRRPKELIVKHDNAFQVARSFAIKRLEEEGEADAPGMFVAAERALVGYNVQSMKD